MKNAILIFLIGGLLSVVIILNMHSTRNNSLYTGMNYIAECAQALDLKISDSVKGKDFIMVYFENDVKFSLRTERHKVLQTLEYAALSNDVIKNYIKASYESADNDTIESLYQAYLNGESKVIKKNHDTYGLEIKKTNRKKQLTLSLE